MKRDILTWPNQTLIAYCRSIHDREVALRIERDLLDSMPDNAVGLAAPQIGWEYRVFVLRGYPHAFVNPALTLGDEFDVQAEGCLSLPGVTVNVRRARRVKIIAAHAANLNKGYTTKLHGLDARAAQHEADHLDGILIRHMERAEVAL